MLKALVWHAQARPSQAVEALKQSLSLAEPEGYVRLFLDEGEPMEQLLQRVSTIDPSSEYVSQLLAAFHCRDEASAKNELGVPRVEPTPSGGQQLQEALNDRELTILRFMAARLSNREIADELFLSVNTVKWHARNLYAKLGVAKRTAAVARSRDPGII